VRAIAFNTLEHWSDNVSADIAAEIQMRCDMDGAPVPDRLRISYELTRRQHASWLFGLSNG
jgi:hypothetical protein